jgi:hypothetical protein
MSLRGLKRRLCDRAVARYALDVIRELAGGRSSMTSYANYLYGLRLSLGEDIRDFARFDSSKMPNGNIEML